MHFLYGGKPYLNRINQEMKEIRFHQTGEKYPSVLFPSLTMVMIVLLGILFPPISTEEINAKENIKQVHCGHAKESERKFQAFPKLGSVFNQLDRDENM